MKPLLLIFLVILFVFPMWALALGLMVVILSKVIGMFSSASSLRMSGTRRTDE